MSIIKSITAREIIDSTAAPCVETTVVLEDGSIGVSSVPSATKTSSYEALEVRDNDEKRYRGLGMLHTIANIQNIIAPQLIGKEASSQPFIDKTMIDLDGTPNKGHLGVHAILSVSQAVAKAAAQSHNMPLFAYLRQFLGKQNIPYSIPRPIFAMLEGGAHGVASVDFQEFLVLPASSKSFSEAFEVGVVVYQAAKQFMKERNLPAQVANEGGFSPPFATNRDALNFLKLALENSPVKFSLDAFFGIDCSANFFYKDKNYLLRDKSGGYTTDELIEYYKGLCSDFGILYLEDPFGEDDWDGWKKLYPSLADKVTIAGDDLTATNPYRVQVALDHQVINCIVIKPQQIGTVTEAIAVAEIARFKNLKITVADRSSETDDSFIADFAVAIAADFVKFGAPARERASKYNRLLAINAQIMQK